MGKNKIVLYVLYVLVIALLVYVGYSTKWFGLSKDNSSTGSSKDSEWQALFLSNGQVYFGKLSDTSSSYVTLKNIYYLQVQKAVQPADSTTTSDSKVTLVKLGNELHAPMDEMKINRTQILFYENLKSDGKVVQAIDKYVTDQANKSTSTNTTK